jgi:hypothetical protein
MRKFVRPGRRERAIGNNHRNRVRALVSSTALVAVSTLFAPAMPAQAQTWTALANSTDWFNPGNWNPAVPPVGHGDGDRRRPLAARCRQPLGRQRR